MAKKGVKEVRNDEASGGVEKTTQKEGREAVEKRGRRKGQKQSEEGRGEKGEKCVILAEVQFEARGLQCAEDKIASLPNAYNRFKKWCAEKNVQVYSENVLLAYFSENAKNYKSSTLWAQYSMVGLILGIAGACRTDELVNLTVDDIEDVGSSLIVKIPNTKTKIPRIFVVTDVPPLAQSQKLYILLEQTEAPEIIYH
ncbi:hypothetical protein NQ317_001572, partial [Molorchus minor]